MTISSESSELTSSTGGATMDCNRVWEETAEINHKENEIQ